MPLLEKLKPWFAPIKPLSREMLHYQTPPDAAQQYRLHLRVEKGGRGLLVINGPYYGPAIPRQPRYGLRRLPPSP